MRVVQPFTSRSLSSRCIASILTAVVTSALLLGGAALAQQAELTVLLRGVQERQDALKSILQEWAETVPGGVRFEFIAASGDVLQHLQVLTAAGVSVDLADITTPHIPLGGYQGILQPLTPFIESDASFSLDEHYPAVFDSVSHAGQIYGFPLGQAGPFLLYYNAERLNSVGVPPPDAGWSWEREMIEYGKVLTRDTNGDGQVDQWAMHTATPYQNGFEATFVWAEGGRMFSEDGKQFLMTSSEAQSALAFIVGLNQLGLLGSVGNYQQGWVNQSYAMTMMGSYGVQYFRNAEFPWDAAPPPTYKGQRYSITWAESPFGMPRTAKNPQLAWEALMFLTGPRGQEMAFKIGIAAPVIRSLVTSQDFLRDTPPNRVIVNEAMAYTRSRPEITRWGEFRPAYNQMIARIMQGEISPLEGMSQIKTMVEAAIAND